MKSNQTKNYYGFKNNKNTINSNNKKYTPGMVGKLALAITVPSALISFISVMVAVFGMVQALMVTFVTFIISFVGCIVISVDIVMFNRRQKKNDNSPKGPKELDIMRIVHLAIGILVGIIIGYLIWGAKYK